jgi:hypothetical protein
VTPLRQEIISVLGKEGWAKAGLDRLELLDSFMKEVQRVYKMNDCEYLYSPSWNTSGLLM